MIRSVGKNEKDRDMSKELIERLRADAESTDDIGLCADAADRIEELERKVASRDAEVAKLKDDNEYLYVAAIERDQLRAKINVLREALSSAESALDESRDYPVTYDEVITALITTPEQSLAEYRNKVIEDCAVKADALANCEENTDGYRNGAAWCAEAIRAMKEQL